MAYNKHMTQKGFTIIESLVAIAVLTLGIMGTMSAAQSGLSSFNFSKNQIVAFYLAQEGFEQIRNIRDENRLNGVDWLTGIAANSSDPCYFDYPCTVSPVQSNALLRCASGPGCSYVKQDQAYGFYGHGSDWVATPFRRQINLSPISATEIAVTVTVTWSKGGVTREFKARENILNW